jgi:hypothetical protein
LLACSVKINLLIYSAIITLEVFILMRLLDIWHLF